MSIYKHKHLLALALLGAFHTYGSAASFDCRKATRPVDRQICDSEMVSRLDVELAIQYSRTRSYSSDPDKVLAEQRQWLSKRDRCQSEACLRTEYEQRIGQLRRPSDQVAQVASVAPTIASPSPQVAVARPAAVSAPVANQPSPQVQACLSRVQRAEGHGTTSSMANMVASAQRQAAAIQECHQLKSGQQYVAGGETHKIDATARIEALADQIYAKGGICTGISRVLRQVLRIRGPAAPEVAENLGQAERYGCFKR